MKLRLYQAIIVLLVALAVLAGIQVAVQSVDVATLPPEWQGLWAGIVFIFTTSAAAPMFTFLRNVLGYAENWFEANPEARKEMHYEAGKLGATWAKYELLIKTYTGALTYLLSGTPYSQYAVYISGAASVLTDLVLKAINDLTDTLKPATVA